MALLPPFMLDCVVAIGITGANNITAWIGTGFFYGYPTTKNEKSEQMYAVYLVTNKHVIGDYSKVWIRLNPQDSQPGRDFELELIDKDGNRKWNQHTDTSIDLAVQRINAGFLRDQNMQFGFFSDDLHVSVRDDLKDGALSEGDPVYVLGFPMGQTGSHRLYAICRFGVIARCRDWIESRAKEILVDASVFPGNSGGPVIAGFYLASITGTKPRQTANLIGIVQSYLPYQDVAISQQTKRPRIVFEENSGLASVIPADFLREILREIHKQGEISTSI
jgi:S1-C subfamily serine protease